MRIFNLHKYKEKRKTLRNISPKSEKILWEKLKGSQFLNLKFRRQQGIGRYVVDFYCPKLKLVIELDGESHDSLNSAEYDKIRTEFFEELGIKVLRFRNDEVCDNINSVLEILKNNLPPSH